MYATRRSKGQILNKFQSLLSFQFYNMETIKVIFVVLKVMNCVVFLNKQFCVLISVCPLILFTSGAKLEFIIIKMHYYRLTPISRREQLRVIEWIRDTSRKRPSKPVYISAILPLVMNNMYTNVSIFPKSDPLRLLRLFTEVVRFRIILINENFQAMFLFKDFRILPIFRIYTHFEITNRLKLSCTLIIITFQFITTSLYVLLNPLK